MRVPKSTIETSRYAPVEIRWMYKKTKSPWRGCLLGALLFFLGVIGLFFGALSDMVYYDGMSPWPFAAIYLTPVELQAETESYPVAVRPLNPKQWTDDSNIFSLRKYGDFDPDNFSVGRPELLIAMDLPVTKLGTMFQSNSGRLPEPGKREVLAGDLASKEDFIIDGETFTVVGELNPTLSGFISSYLLLDKENYPAHFSEEHEEVFPGVLLPQDGLVLPNAPTGNIRRPLPDKYRSDDTEGDASLTAATAVDGEGEQEVPQMVLPAMLGGIVRTHGIVAWWSFYHMLLCAVGGVYFFMSLFKALHQRQCRLFRPVYQTMAEHRWLFIFTHLLLYGVFFSSMYAALSYPEIALLVKRYIMNVFSEGGLEYIGSAYDDGNVLQATWATFYNNYVDQTLLMTFAISLILPLGVFKNIGSFLLVGGAMTPLWVGTAQVQVLHSFTMVVELEAYIIACFVMILWPFILIQGMRKGKFREALKKGCWLIFNTALLTAVILLLAAFYEAVSLIGFTQISI